MDAVLWVHGGDSGRMFVHGGGGGHIYYIYIHHHHLLSNRAGRSRLALLKSGNPAYQTGQTPCSTYSSYPRFAPGTVRHHTNRLNHAPKEEVGCRQKR